ncbi:hypothetical protein CPB83DRAFT_849458 [Crepidotus variabilis]|uniref:Uncharacterized protein n=1 Tax=Crepidotus variabilis TaxID=179855 RepID=A0A9P6ELL2_9AGAR|nr:hypothetical protein CPB83DRAFT_849458 [Crepidotus variabilis]
MQVSVISWPEKVRRGSKWACREISELLVSIISARSFLAQSGIEEFDLLQNPQFFTRFPHTLDTFLRQSKDTSTATRAAEPLDLRTKVADFSAPFDLHLIVDRKLGIAEDDPEVSCFGDDAKHVASEYTNIWKLEGEDRFIVRDKCGSLICADPRRMTKARHLY